MNKTGYDNRSKTFSAHLLLKENSVKRNEAYSWSFDDAL